MGLAKKILNVMKECAKLSYDSRNNEGGYNFVSAAKVNAAVNAALSRNGLIQLATTEYEKIESHETPKGIEYFVAVTVNITLIDTDNEDGDESYTIIGAGSGTDIGGKENATAKAQTMAVKYAWKNTLLIADTADDPDAVVPF